MQRGDRDPAPDETLVLRIVDSPPLKTDPPVRDPDYCRMKPRPEPYSASIDGPIGGLPALYFAVRATTKLAIVRITDFEFTATFDAIFAAWTRATIPQNYGNTSPDPRPANRSPECADQCPCNPARQCPDEVANGTNSVLLGKQAEGEQHHQQSDAGNGCENAAQTRRPTRNPRTIPCAAAPRPSEAGARDNESARVATSVRGASGAA